GRLHPLPRQHRARAAPRRRVHRAARRLDARRRDRSRLPRVRHRAGAHQAASLPPLERRRRFADERGMRWKRLLAIALAPYAVWLVVAYQYHFLDGVNLAFHEAGHLFLGFGGNTLHVLGGTIGQLFFPLLLALRFRGRGESFEAGVCTLWLGESLMNVAVY